ncbi:fatty-acid amide hydrolase 1-like [Oncorhynchus keta]|uniref:fatty-acid amide hydrolase 1-like n=1 Tax=Oncorhynchus keta TaxID=8018 RepID=UPI0015FC6B4E|nr:fatty-acid amide hydrolase 1-like [Oncorhynchus keta]XP_052331248.1 fatty-acid amide hydrolase 1-like [Oncorhynchus keta]
MERSHIGLESLLCKVDSFNKGVMDRMDNYKQLIFGAKPKWTVILTVTACGASALVLLLKWFRHQQSWKKIQKAKVRREKSLQRAEHAVCQFNESHPETDTSLILSLSLAELSKQLKDGTLTPQAVFHSYMEKTLEVNRRLNCCTEVLLESWDQLEDVYSHKDGLLYGVPVSIKENIGYKGHDSTCGVICKLDLPATRDSVLVEVLKRQGAIPFVKTNVPQGLQNFDCGNPIYGLTLNPHNPQKTSGGSSGGEGALIGGGGSVLGLGSDIGGSIRIPSSFCGICGFKPTANRLSLRGASSCIRGQKSVLSSLGPMARDVDSLALCMQALLCDHMFRLDPTVPPISFNQQVYQSSKPLRIGYYENDGYAMPSPSMGRALRETKALLEKAGHTLVSFSPPRLIYAMHELVVRGLLGDGCTTLLSHLKGGPVDPCLRDQIIPYSLPRTVKKILSILLKRIFPRIAASLDSLRGVGSVQDLWRHHADVEDYIHEVIAEWRRCELDVLLCPMVGPAYIHNYPGQLTSTLTYTIIYNLLNFPAGVVPVSTVTAEDEEELRHYEGNYGDLWDKLYKKAVTGGEGLPVAVQCVALPWQDELCLRFMREVEMLVREDKK